MHKVKVIKKLKLINDKFIYNLYTIYKDNIEKRINIEINYLLYSNPENH